MILGRFENNQRNCTANDKIHIIRGCMHGLIFHLKMDGKKMGKNYDDL